MRVFVLGGTGRIGRAVARVLAGDSEVSEIGIGGRDRSLAQGVSREVGPKALPVGIDALDETRLARIVEPYDLIVNTAGPDFLVAVPALRAAIAAGTHYCDIAADASSTEAALSLAGAAKEAGVTALTGIGHMPGETNLLARHAASQLDDVESVRICVWFALSRETYTAMGDPEGMRASGRVSASWQTILAWVARRVPIYRDGRRLDVEPFVTTTEVSLPGGSRVSAYPVASSEAITLPRNITGVRTVEVLMSLDPPQLNDLLRVQAARVIKGETDAAKAALTFLETLATDKDRWLSPSGRTHPSFGMLASAVGTRNGERIRFSCWPATNWASTVGASATAVRGILRGTIRERGVFSPEAILDPISFLRDASRFGPEPPRIGQLLDESIELID